MLLLDRATGALRDALFADFSSMLQPGDLLVLTTAASFRRASTAAAHCYATTRKPTGRHRSHAYRAVGDDLWRALVRPAVK